MMDNFFIDQAEKRAEYLQLILDSDSRKKIIVAGPGTGKTYTFKQVFLNTGSTNNLALTFIRKLVNDMDDDFGDLAEVKTFHAFCKKLLHEKEGGFELFPFLEQLIEEDSDLLGFSYSNFSNHFQLLNEDSQQISFYITRGNYYNAVSFNDSVYRVLKISETDPDFIPKYDQIVIDEFQDFNPLEVSFINLLEKNNKVLITGDDDQAVYALRNSSSEHIRDKYYSGDYDKFELPFCSRCPKVVVDATSSFIKSVIDCGGLQSRINRKFYPYLEGNESVNSRYPKIVTAEISTISVMGNFIKAAIEKIPDDEIQEANEEGNPCVLIVGKRQYLNPIYKKLSKNFSNLIYSPSEEINYTLLDAYKVIIRKPESNIGWRIIASIMLDQDELESVIERSRDFTPMINLLPADIVNLNVSILELLKSESLDLDILNDKIEGINEDFNPIINYFYPPEAEDELEDESAPDNSEPLIMFTSFEGCKGLSASHVFIVGLNKGIVPKVNEVEGVSDIEYSKFIVAMTRTRKLLYLLSNRYDYNPRKGRNYVSPFINLIPNVLKTPIEYIKSSKIMDFLNHINENLS
ncbi:ATP-dependent helicase [Chloroflexota bacterium]|nr:ATP-dependent helicase [Chloroflexota bacterium]